MRSVLIAGGGYAGVRAARVLAHILDPDWTIRLLDERSHHELLTRLPEIVSGRLDAQRARIPYSRILPRRVEFHQCDILAIQPSERRVETTTGTYDADHLIVGLGSAAHSLGIPGVETQALTLRSVEDATTLREMITTGLTAQRRLHVAIVGAGYTATEVAGELADWIRAGEAGLLEVTLIAEDSRLLELGNSGVSELAASVLRRKGVRTLLGIKLDRVSEGQVELVGREAILADILLWAARSRPVVPPPHDAWTFTPDGRVEVDEYLRVPSYVSVYAVGDLAGAVDYKTGGTVPGNAQFAIQAGETAARNVVADVERRRPRSFRPRSLGEALSLGRDDAVAEVLGVIVTGVAAQKTKEAALVRYLYGLGGIRLVQQYR